MPVGPAVSVIVRVLARIAGFGRAILVLGLLIGIAAPPVAIAMGDAIPELVAAMLFAAALRIGPREAFGAVRDTGTALGLAALHQMALPAAALALFMLFGWHGVLATSLILMLAAPPISGSPNITLMTGNDPAPALRQLVIGTAVLPLTVIPIFALAPELGDLGDVFLAAGRLLVVIVVATGLGFLVRATAIRHPSTEALRAIDGAAAILMGTLVIGLMSAVGPALFQAPGRLLLTLAVVFSANFALQAVTAVTMRAAGRPRLAAPLGIVAGNRNIALFVVALPAEVIAPLLLFIGCYQIPMYLTPILLGRFYAPEEPRAA